MTTHFASRSALLAAVLVTALAADATGSPQARKTPAPKTPAPKTPNADAMLDTVKESVAIIKGKYGHGSGFLVAADLVVTNSHVVLCDRVEDLSVRFTTNGLPDAKTLKVKLLYEDKARDLVVLRLDEPQTRRVVPIAEGFKPDAAPTVFVVGSPAQGQPGVALSNTVGTARFGKDTTLIHDQPFYNLEYATEASAIRIGPGNSGGPVVNTLGQVVGVLTRGDSGTDGRPTGKAYCIPAAAVRAALDDLGPANGWEAKGKKATAQHALDIAMIGAYANTVIGAALVEVRVAVPEKVTDRYGYVDWGKLLQLNKGLSKAYKDVDAELSKITTPAMAASLLNPDLTARQKDRLRAVNNDLKELRRIASNKQISDYEGRWAVGCEKRTRKAFDLFRDEGKMPVDFLIQMEETILRKAGIDVEVKK